MNRVLNKLPVVQKDICQVPISVAQSKKVRMRESFSKDSLIIIALCAGTALATIVFSIAAARLETTYLDNYGFFYDPAAYYVRNITVFKYFQEHGLWQSLVNETIADERCPGRIIPYLLFAPKLLTTLMGHMWSEMPVLWAFLALLSTTIYQRTKSLLLPIAATALFLAVPFLLDPKLGVGAYWLDFTSACALGCAAICLIRYLHARHNGWMFAFGAFASATTLCRWSAACYLLVFIGFAIPTVIAANSLAQWKESAKSLLYATLTAMPGVCFFLNFFGYNSWYYKQFGYAFDAPINQSLAWTFSALRLTFGDTILSILLGLTAINTVGVFISKNGRARALISLWAPAAVLVFLCGIAKAVDGFHPIVYFAPALFVSAFCPIGRTDEKHRMWLRTISILLTAFALTTTIQSYETLRRMAKTPPEFLKLQKQVDAAIAKYIVATNSASFHQFDSETVMPHMEVFFYHGRLCRWESVFSMHESYLHHLYKKQTPAQMADSAYKTLNSRIALTAVFADPEVATKAFNNPYSVAISQEMAKRIAHDKRWKFIDFLNSPKGKLAVYQNTALPAEAATLTKIER